MGSARLDTEPSVNAEEAVKATFSHQKKLTEEEGKINYAGFVSRPLPLFGFQFKVK